VCESLQRQRGDVEECRWVSNRGYGTQLHRLSKKLGPCSPRATATVTQSATAEEPLDAPQC